MIYIIIIVVGGSAITCLSLPKLSSRVFPKTCHWAHEYVISRKARKVGASSRKSKGGARWRHRCNILHTLAAMNTNRMIQQHLQLPQPSSSARKRLALDLKEIQASPLSTACAAPLKDNLFEWYVCCPPCSFGLKWPTNQLLVGMRIFGGQKTLRTPQLTFMWYWLFRPHTLSSHQKSFRVRN